ncbi:MAG TPA: VOC family protein [Longimicrobiales bacterium]
MHDFRLPDATRLGGLTLRVADAARSLAFYRDVIGLRPLASEGGRATLSATGRAPALLTLEERAGARPRPRHTAGLYHFALLVPTRRDLAAVLRHLHECRWPMAGASDHDVSEALYLSDPDGNGIEIYADRPRDRWRWTDGAVAMTTTPLDLRGLLAELEPEAPAWTGLPEGTVLGHVHLHVPDLDAAEAFYHGALGFDVVNDSYPGARFLSAGRYHHHVGLNVWAGLGVPPTPEDAAGMTEYEVVLPDLDASDRLLDHARAAGAGPQPDPRGWRTLDPAGVRVVVRVGDAV